ncbi:hypothetical protein HDU67_010358, partial [Dinochytrium kinnereticum]
MVKKAEQAQNIELRLHVAIAAGVCERVIMGTQDRMDYSVSSKYIKSLGPGLDNSESGELGISSEAWDALELNESDSSAFFHKIIPNEDTGNIYIIVKESVSTFRSLLKHKQLHPVNGGSNESIAHRPSLNLPGIVRRESKAGRRMDARSGPVRNTSIRRSIISPMDEDTVQDSEVSLFPILQKFINQSLLRYLLRVTQGANSTARRSSAAAIEDGYSSGNFTSGNGNPSKLGRRITTSTSISRARRLQNGNESKVEEYRQVSVVFVKILNARGREFSVRDTHVIVSIFLEALKLEDGVFQQYSVDDKGQTLLGVFGLPPWPRKKEQVAALTASHTFLKNHFASIASSHKGEDIIVRISVASGPILFSELGNDYRRDASLLGDVVNIAARILSLESANNRIACDSATQEAAMDVFGFSKLGNFMFKGKKAATDIWLLTNNGASNNQSTSKLDSALSINGFSKHREKEIDTDLTPDIGYREQRGMIASNVDIWQLNGGFHTILVEGASGLGKSNLLKYFEKLCGLRGISTCLSQGSEVDQWTTYFGIRVLVATIYNSRSRSSTGIFLGNELLQRNLLNFSGSKASSSSLNSSHRNKITSSRPSNPDMRRSSRISTFSMLQNEETGNSEDDASAKAFLCSFREDERLAPLLNALLPHLRPRETKWSLTLDGKARASLLKSLIIRIVNKWVAEGNKYAFIFDDAQWIDLSSLDIIKDIVDQSPN